MTLPTQIHTREDLEILRFSGADGLLPVVAQHHTNGRVLMLAYANREALEATLETGTLHFWSRARRQLWKKGETSGNVLRVRRLTADCDGDTVLAHVHPTGPVCHTGSRTCFGEESTAGLLDRLWAKLESRRNADPATSYTASLYGKGTKRIAQKVGEEGVEVALAAMAKDREELINESADLLYHLTVLLQNEGLGLKDVVQRLYERHTK